MSEGGGTTWDESPGGDAPWGAPASGVSVGVSCMEAMYGREAGATGLTILALSQSEINMRAASRGIIDTGRTYSFWLVIVECHCLARRGLIGLASRRTSWPHAESN